MQVLLIGRLHPVIHHAGVAHHLCVAPPGAILREAVVVGAEGGHHDALQPVDILIGAPEAACLLQIRGHDQPDCNVSVRILAVLAQVKIAGNLHIAVGVIGKARAINLALRVTARNVHILLDALRGKRPGGTEIQTAVRVDCLGKPEYILRTARGGTQVELGYARRVLAHVDDPRAVLLAADLPDRLRGQCPDHAHRRHEAQLQCALRHRVCLHRRPAVLLSVGLCEIRRFQPGVIGLAAVKVIQHDGAALTEPPLGAGGNSLSLPVLIDNLQLGAQARVTVPEAADRPHAALGIPALAEQCRQRAPTATDGQEAAYVVDAVQHLTVVIGHGRVYHILGYLLPVDVILPAPQSADIQPCRAHRRGTKVKLCAQIGRPTHNGAAHADPDGTPVTGVQRGGKGVRQLRRLADGIGHGDGQAEVGAGRQCQRQRDSNRLRILKHAGIPYRAHTGFQPDPAGRLTHIAPVGLQHPRDAQSLAGQERRTPNTVYGQLTDFQHRQVILLASIAKQEQQKAIRHILS